MSPDLQLMKTSIVANHGLHKITRCSPRLFFIVRIMKSTRYSQESKDTNISSNTPSGLITDLSTDCNNVGVY